MERRDEMEKKFEEFLQSLDGLLLHDKAQFLKILEILESAKTTEAVTSREYKIIFEKLFYNSTNSELMELVGCQECQKSSRTKARIAILRVLKDDMRKSWRSADLLDFAKDPTAHGDLRQLAIEVMAEHSAGFHLSFPKNEELLRNTQSKYEEIRKSAQLALRIIAKIKSRRKKLHLDPCFFSDGQEYPLSGPQQFPIKNK